jgi:hypothetical protein
MTQPTLNTLRTGSPEVAPVLQEQEWVYEGPVSPETIAESAESDTAINQRYADTSAIISGIEVKAFETHNNIIASSRESISANQSELETHYEHLDAAADLLIAAIREQRDRLKDQARLDVAIRVEQGEKVIAEAEAFLRKNQTAVVEIRQEVERGSGAQSHQEALRAELIHTIDVLCAEYDEKKSSIAKLESDLTQYHSKISVNEEYEDILLTDLKDITIREKIERNSISQSQIEAIATRWPDSPATTDTIAEILRKATSTELSAILAEAESVNEKIKHNKRAMDDLASLADGAALTIHTLQERLLHIQSEIDTARQKLDFDRQKATLFLQKHSGDAVATAETYEAILGGNTTHVAEGTLAEVLNPVWEQTRQLQMALTRDSEAAQAFELKDPELDIEMLSPLLGGSEVFYASSLAETIETRDRGAELIDNARALIHVGNIRGGLIAASALLNYRAKPQEQQD